MNEKTTSRLDSILKSTSKKNFDEYAKEINDESLPSLMDYFNEFIGDRKISDIINSSLLSRDYAYGIFNGTKTSPSRDRIIALCVAMNMSLVQTQRALKIAGVSVLYAKSLRDAAIIACINNGDSVMDINLFLTEKGLDPLATTR